jgi:hypothetical protein
MKKFILLSLCVCFFSFSSSSIECPIEVDSSAKYESDKYSIDYLLDEIQCRLEKKQAIDDLVFNLKTKFATDCGACFDAFDECITNEWPNTRPCFRGLSSCLSSCVP